MPIRRENTQKLKRYIVQTKCIYVDVDIYAYL